MAVHAHQKHSQEQSERLPWETPYPLPHKILSTLWQRQRNLERLEVFAPFIKDSWDREKELSDVDLLADIGKIEFPSLVKVRAVPDSPETALIACAALKREKVTALEVDGRLWHDGDARIIDTEGEQANSDDDDDKLEVKDPLTEYLFDHIKPVKPGIPPYCGTIKTLVLKDINLSLCKHTWFCYLELCRLKTLCLEHCVGADIFLIQLTAGAATPKLQSFTLVHDLGAPSDRTIHGIEELLSFPRNKLERLELSLRNAHQLPSVSSIRAHGKTLRSLILDIHGKQMSRTSRPGWAGSRSSSRSNGPAALVYDTDDFESIVHSCVGIVELGISFPPISLEESSFEGIENGFTLWTDFVVRHLELTTLNVLNWPEEYENARSRGARMARNVQSQRLADYIFSSHRRY